MPRSIPRRPEKPLGPNIIRAPCTMAGAGGFEPPCAGLEDRSLNPLGHAPELQQKRYLSHADSSPIISRCFAWIPNGAGFRMSGIPASAGVLSAFRLLHP